MTNDFVAQDYIDLQLKKIKDQIGSKQVICTVSGGLISTVTALITSHALNNQGHFIFIDTGLLRYNEAYEALSFLRKNLNLNIWHIDAKKLFLNRIKNINDPEAKTKKIKDTFFDVLTQAAKDLNVEFNYLIDHSNCFNSFENDLEINLQVIEPLLGLSRNNVREIGNALNLPKDLIDKAHFSISGLANRINGEVTNEKLDLIRKSDYIFSTLMQDTGLNLIASNYFCALLINDFEKEITNECKKITVLVKSCRSTNSDDNGFIFLPYNFLKNFSDQICLQIPKISSVFYDITTKPCMSIKLK